MTFQKGQSGNPGGANKRQKRFAPALERAIRAAKLQQGTDALDAIAARLINEALTADNPLPAIKEIADRLDGKSFQAVGGDDSHDPQRHVLSWEKNDDKPDNNPI